MEIDPMLVLCEDVLPMIFQHLSVRDILRSSLVLPSWNAVIGNSSMCMKKICLRFYHPIDDIDILSKSIRKYQSCKIQREIPPALYSLFNKTEWKQIMIRDIPMMDHNEFMTIMTQLAPSIEELDLWEVGTSLLSEETSIEFPKLRRLEMSLSTRQMFSVFTGHNPQLREVKLTRTPNFFFSTHKIMLSPNLIDKFLFNNSQIETLYLDEVNEMFLVPINHKVTNIRSLTLSPEYMQSKKNIIKFIEQQVNIKEIKLLKPNFTMVYVDHKRLSLPTLLKAAKLPNLR